MLEPPCKSEENRHQIIVPPFYPSAPFKSSDLSRFNPSPSIPTLHQTRPRPTANLLQGGPTCPVLFCGTETRFNLNAFWWCSNVILMVNPLKSWPSLPCPMTYPGPSTKMSRVALAQLCMYHLWVLRLYWSPLSRPPNHANPKEEKGKEISQYIEAQQMQRRIRSKHKANSLTN